MIFRWSVRWSTRWNLGAKQFNSNIPNLVSVLDKKGEILASA